MQPVKQSHPSADRNCKPIAEALQSQIPLDVKNLQLLEIASGSGQHAGYLANLFPNITFQPSEVDPTNLPSIRAYAQECNNIKEPLVIDITKHPKDWPHQFPEGSFDYMLNFNMMHISPFEASIGLFQAAGLLLKPKGKLFTYGPYAENGKLTPESNVMFDLSLKSRNPTWGVRDIADLAKLAKANGLELTQKLDMPANNKTLTWTKLS